MNIITVDVSQALVERDGKAESEKKHLLEMAAEIVKVEDATEQAVAVLRARGIKSWLAEVERARKAVKAPVRALEQRIDDIARDHCKELNDELERLSGLVSAFQESERRRVAEEEIRRQEEIQRLLREKQEKETAAAVAVEAVTEAEAGLTEAEQAMLAQAEAKAAEAEFDVAVRAPVPKVEKVTGLIVRKDVVRFEVTDAAALYAVHPEWFELTPRRRLMGELITKETKLPGLRVWTEDATGFRR